jgi:outer membrane murein-binding lipoprotein Lpp
LLSFFSIKQRAGGVLAGGLLVAGCLASTGCQIDVAGQTLPSPYHLTDDVQYYAPGPEFKLAREAAAMAEQRANQISQPQEP